MLEIPLLHIDTVFFPGIPVQLFITDNQHKALVRFCLMNKRPFGVVPFLSSDISEHESMEPDSYGCLTYIKSVEELERGCFSLSAIAQERIQIVGLRRDKGLLFGQVKLVPIRSYDVLQAEKASQRLKPWVIKFIQLQSETGGLGTGLCEMPARPLALACLAAHLLNIHSDSKRALLRCDSTSELLNALISHYRREATIMEAIAMTDSQKVESYIWAN